MGQVDLPFLLLAVRPQECLTPHSLSFLPIVCKGRTEISTMHSSFEAQML